MSRALLACTCLLVAACSAGTGPGDAAILPTDSGAGDMELPGDLAVVEDSLNPPPPTTCDPIAQDCMDPMTPKCTVTVDSDGTAPRCVAPLGKWPEGHSCMRIEEGLAGQGNDDCAAGLFCTSVGAEGAGANPARVCQRFCRADVDCDGGFMCVKLDGQTPPDGACVPACTLFGSDCPVGMACASATIDVDGQNDFATCRAAGMVANGEACASETDCPATSFCLDPNHGTDYVCDPICDANHPCANSSCVAQPSLANGGGYCR